jgi:hypothetical protein
VSSPLARSLAAMNEMLMDFWAGTVTERILARDPMEEIRRAFQLFDDDNTGRISIRNLRRVAKEIGDRLEDDELCVIPLFLWPPPMFTDTAGRQTSDDRRIRPRPGWRDKRARVFRYHDGRGIVLSLDFLAFPLPQTLFLCYQCSIYVQHPERILLSSSNLVDRVSWGNHPMIT